ncbi:MAG: hypothetical protein GWN58_13750 [Anaerolineae bacterium]|nr:hypothetical protein [Anaerolineae bacterium]
MPRGNFFGPPGQREGILRGERTDPRVIIGQGIGLAVVLLFAFGVIRVYIYYWDWITRYKRHGTFAPIAIILVGVCLVVGAMLFVEILDPNWPNPREATGSTRPLFPWSKEKQQPQHITNISLADVVAGVQVALDEYDAERDDDESADLG